VLDVAPVHLLVPLEHEQPYQITPTGVEPAGLVRDLGRGADALDGMNQRAFFSEVPEREWQPIGERSQVHRGGRLGTYRERRQAQALAALDHRAAQGDPEAQALVNVLDAQLPDWRQVLGVADG
jgi:hypothetical protein